ncbi:unnamed protein product [Nesidiocoris tenuis]|uniref:Uncharacterized protein n=1 Tax=Nesidiocoris tenuis TaxID=355587 RepID=A0A6H5H5I6_9HEMI|nr:unnamed protein product [Nesidiocoris tenuis]
MTDARGGEGAGGGGAKYAAVAPVFGGGGPMYPPPPPPLLTSDPGRCPRGEGRIGEPSVGPSFPKMEGKTRPSSTARIYNEA